MMFIIQIIASCMAWSTFCVLCITVLPVLVGVHLFRGLFRGSRKKLPRDGRHVAFFHPWCDVGGGRERVLWSAIGAIQERYPDHWVYVYTLRTEEARPMVDRVKRQFGVELTTRLELVPLGLCWLLDEDLYLAMGRVCRSFGTVLVALEALFALMPDVYIDSSGYPMTLPVFRLLGGCSVCCYVHKPDFTAEQLRFSVPPLVTSSWYKLVYRHLPRLLQVAYNNVLARLHALAASAAHVLMVNSTWTQRHVARVWRRPDDTLVVFPPCETKLLSVRPPEAPRDMAVVSVAQFDLEKDHSVQMRSLTQLVQDHAQLARHVQLLMVGRCRGPDDMKVVEGLRRLSQLLGIPDRVHFFVNVAFDQLVEVLENYLIGIHTTKDDPFGIGVVEMMSAGLLVIAHKSGGPLTDIIRAEGASRTGFLATDSSEYAQYMHRILAMDDNERLQMRQRARNAALRFSRENFNNAFLSACRTALGA